MADKLHFEQQSLRLKDILTHRQSSEVGVGKRMKVKVSVKAQRIATYKIEVSICSIVGLWRNSPRLLTVLPLIYYLYLKVTIIMVLQSESCFCNSIYFIRAVDLLN